MPTFQTATTGAAPARGSLERSSDHDLARAAGKDGAAFSELYRRHFRHVYGYHLLRTGNVDDAQDLTSQTFIAALESIHRFDGRGSFAAWLMGIAHHKMASHYRRKRPEADLEAGENLPNPHHSLEEIAYHHGLMRRVQQALRRLAPDRAESFSLRVFGGLSAAETAEVLGKTEGAVKMLVHRAVKDLRALLDVDFHQVEEA